MKNFESPYSVDSATPSPEKENEKLRKRPSPLTAAILSGVTLFGNHDAEATKRIRHSASNTEIRRESGSETVFDNNAEFLRTVTVNGDFTPEERLKRTITLANGATVFKDVGLLLYRVKEGDTLAGIRTSLADLPEFFYLKNQTGKLESFNIPEGELRTGMWLPIPMENEDRYITEEEFIRYASSAIKDLKTDAHYGKFVDELLRCTSEQDILATMVAFAKQEAGGKPLGRFELHRWEPEHNVFSFSLFHILMEGAGLEARRTLNLSEGQLYHPENAVKLFIAFLKEKHVEPAKYFPLEKHVRDFARMYNGKRWKHWNPHYVRDILRYYHDAQETLKTSLAQPMDSKRAVVENASVVAMDIIPPKMAMEVERMKVKKPQTQQSVKARIPERREVQGIFWENIGTGNLTVALRNANLKYTKAGGKTVFRSDKEMYSATKFVISYLKRLNGNDKYYPEDSVGVCRDKAGPFIRFRSARNGKTKEGLIRIR